MIEDIVKLLVKVFSVSFLCPFLLLILSWVKTLLKSLKALTFIGSYSNQIHFCAPHQNECVLGSYSTIYKTSLWTNNNRKAHLTFVVDLQVLYGFHWQFLSSGRYVVASGNQLSWVFLGFVSGKFWQSSQSSHKQVDVWNQSKSCNKMKCGWIDLWSTAISLKSFF